MVLFKLGSVRGFFLLGVIATLLAITKIAYAQVIPLTPRLSALGYTSNHTVGQVDLLFPLQGDSAHNLYVDPALSYATNNQDELDLGLGYRWIQNKAAILGGYLFAGYSRIDNNARLWIINPGVEILASRWDAHLNAYFPAGDRHYGAGASSASYFSGHAEFVNIFQAEQFVGNGADIKFGYQLFPNSSWKGYLGSYFFTPAQSSNIWGGAAGLEYWLDSYLKIIGSYTYDRLHHSTYALGLGVEFGGTRAHRINPVLEERITDPIERHLAELGQGSAMPVSTNKQFSGLQLLRDNIAFFSQIGGPNNGGNGLVLANCTYENPCGPTDFSQAGVNTLNGLLPNTSMYFNGGTYGGPDNPINLNNGQSMHSRTNDYKQPATGSARSSFNKQIVLNGNNTLENIILLPPTPTAPFGITVNNANNQITGSQIGDANNPFTLGIVDKGQNTIINNSDIFSSKYAINIDGASNSTVLNSRIYAKQGDVFATGIRIDNGSTVSIKNAQIQVVSSGGGGIESYNSSSVDIQDSVIQASIPNNSNGQIAGVFANGSTISVKNTQIQVKVEDTGSLVGMEAVNNAFIGANNITVNVIHTGHFSGDDAIAVEGSNAASQFSQVTVNNSTLNVTVNVAQAVIAFGNTTINNTACKINGTSVSCS